MCPPAKRIIPYHPVTFTPPPRARPVHEATGGDELVAQAGTTPDGLGVLAHHYPPPRSGLFPTARPVA